LRCRESDTEPREWEAIMKMTTQPRQMTTKLGRCRCQYARSGWYVRDGNISAVGETDVRQTTMKPWLMKVSFG
jgi:hypothetical protein